MNEVFSFLSESGDEYRLSLTTSVGGELIAEDISESLLRDGIELVDVGLSRVKGSHITTFSILQQIEQCIANVFMQHPNAIICFFCDFTRKPLDFCQKYCIISSRWSKCPQTPTGSQIRWKP